MDMYLIQGTTLTDIADNVRALTGSTGPMSPDKMSTEIQVAKQNTDDAMNALASLGVEVPEGANIGDLAGLIEDVNNSGGVALPELTNAGVASDLIEGKELIDADGNVVTGTMTDNGAINSTMDGITTKSISVPAGYTSGGTVGLDDTIDNEVDAQAELLTQILAIIETKVGHNKIYVGASEPTDDLGTNGDIYVMGV